MPTVKQLQNHLIKHDIRFKLSMKKSDLEALLGKTKLEELEEELSLADDYVDMPRMKSIRREGDIYDLVWHKLKDTSSLYSIVMVLRKRDSNDHMLVMGECRRGGGTGLGKGGAKRYYQEAKIKAYY